MIREKILFLNKEECDSLITICKTQSCNINIKNYIKAHPFEIKDESHFIFSKIREFISIETGLPKENQECILCIRYGENGGYHEHYDTFICPSHALAKDIDTQLLYDSNMSQGGHRKHTAIIYLNDDFSGGETYFTKLNKIIKPETGKIVLWKNIKENNEIDESMLHTGKSILSKEKWILIVYIREKIYNK